MKREQVSRYRAVLAYRRAVLIEEAEQIFIHKMRLCKGPERHACNESLILIGWEVRELERLLPNVSPHL